MQRCFRCLSALADRDSACPRCQTRVFSPMQIGQILVEEKTITQSQLDDALVFQKATGRRLGNILTEKGYLSEREFAECLARQLDMPFFDLDEYIIDPAVVSLLPDHLCERYRLIPLMKNGGKLVIAFADPLNCDALADLQLSTDLPIKPVVATPDDINRALSQAFDAIVSRHELAQTVDPSSSRPRADRRSSRRGPTHAIASRPGSSHLRRIR